MTRPLIIAAAAAAGGDRNLFGRNNDLRGSVEVSQIGYGPAFAGRVWRETMDDMRKVLARENTAIMPAGNDPGTTLRS